MIKKCKNCRSETNIEPINDFKYQFDSDDPIELINGFKCSICNAIYSIKDNKLMFWEFEIDSNTKDTFKAVENYATDQKVALNEV